ncbi:MAG: hypothetical protein CME61_05135, partial [Halobacteriovoraceae bacterium]|nr:hypothetical protein [Halobacteriovoraceae bacterium]
TISIELNSLTCQSENFSASRRKRVRINFCQDLESAGINGCVGSEANVSSFKVRYLSAPLSSLNEISLDRVNNVSSNCYPLEFSKTNFLPSVSPLGENSWPLPYEILSYSDENCENLVSTHAGNKAFYFGADENALTISHNENLNIFIENQIQCSNNSDCLNGKVCNALSGVCQSSIGGTCEVAGHCVQGDCSSDTCVCTSNEHCPENNLCLGNICYPTIGGLCLNSTECVYGDCIDLICQTVGYGSTCDENLDCTEGSCLGTSCACVTNASCPENYSCDLTSGSCLGEFGASCLANSDCKKGNCENSVCMPLGEGNSCDTGSDCLSGYCKQIEGQGICRQSSYFFNSSTMATGLGDGGNYILIEKTIGDTHSPSIDSTTDFTISIWFRARSSEGQLLFAMKDSAASQHGAIRAAVHGCPFGLSTVENEICFNINDKDDHRIKNRIKQGITNVDLTDHQWHLFSVTKELNEAGTEVLLSIYIDDTLQAQETIAAEDFPVPESSQIFIGKNMFNNPVHRSFFGELDEFAVWERALSSDEVSSIYQANRESDYRYTISNYTHQGKLKLYLKMNIDLEQQTTNLITYSDYENSWTSSFVGSISNYVSEVTTEMASFKVSNLSQRLEVSPSNITPTAASHASQGSDWPSFTYPASNVIDNDLNTMSHTATGGDAWLKLDLGSNHYISKVEFSNRQDCCQERFRNINLYIGEDSDVFNTNSYDYLSNELHLIAPFTHTGANIPVSDNDYQIFKFQEGIHSTVKTNQTVENQSITTQAPLILGRYVGIDRESDGFGDLTSQTVLQISEFDIFGFEVNKSTTQFLEECSNSVQDLHEEGLNCGGSICSPCP